MSDTTTATSAGAGGIERVPLSLNETVAIATVSPAVVAGSIDPATTAAGELRRIADAIAALAGTALPRPYVSISVMPSGSDENDEAGSAFVDAIAAALGHEAKTVKEGATWRHVFRSGDQTTRVYLSAWHGLADGPTQERKRLQADRDRLAAENVRLRAALDGGREVPQ